MKYYCEKCKRILSHAEITEISFCVFDTQYTCDYCENDVLPVYGNELCPVCGQYHKISDDYRECAEKIYTKKLAQAYILETDNIKIAMAIMQENKMTLFDYVTDEAAAFVEFWADKQKQPNLAITA